MHRGDAEDAEQETSGCSLVRRPGAASALSLRPPRLRGESFGPREGVDRPRRFCNARRPEARNRMKIRKAVITAAGRSQRALPLQTLVDRDGWQKSCLRIIVDEALSTGVEEVCVVVSPGDQAAYADAAGDAAGRLQFVEQARPLGYGHALLAAREFAGHDPFLHLVSD